MRESSETKEAASRGKEKGGGEGDGQHRVSTGYICDLAPPPQQGWRAMLVIKGYRQQARVITMTTSFCHLRCPVLS